MNAKEARAVYLENLGKTGLAVIHIQNIETTIHLAAKQGKNQIYSETFSEDDWETRVQVGKYFENLGYRVITVYNRHLFKKESDYLSISW